MSKKEETPKVFHPVRKMYLTMVNGVWVRLYLTPRQAALKATA